MPSGEKLKLILTEGNEGKQRTGAGARQQPSLSFATFCKKIPKISGTV